jgi:peptidoglycan DL-endopeptidase CwlO
MLAKENRHENPAIWHHVVETWLPHRRTRWLGRLRSADVLGRTRTRTARLAALAAVLTLTAATAALAAPGTANRGATVQQLDSQSHQALLSLYALDSRLQAWRSRVASLAAAATALRKERAALRQGLSATRSSLKVGQHQLALDLRTLYEQGNVDPVAVMLGSESLAKGLRKLDNLSRVADQSRQIVETTTDARRRLLRSQARLAAEQRRLARALAAAREAERQVAAAAASRRAYISSLRAQEEAAQVQSVVATAQQAQQTSQQLQPATTPPPPTGARQLVVSATCYDLPGKTATGMPVGIGVVAVDPSVIALGTRMYVPGYGDAVAADVGGAIKGAVIDLWMPPSQCMAWGRRTVTITLH